MTHLRGFDFFLETKLWKLQFQTKFMNKTLILANAIQTVL